MAIGLALLALAALPALASDRPPYARDDTWSAVPPDTLEKGIAFLGTGTADPASLQLRLLAPMKDPAKGMCGEVNAKDSAGFATPFIPFMVSLDPDSAKILDPRDETPEGLKAMHAAMLDACPQWSVYADRQARIEAAISNDPEVPADSPSMIVLNFCNYTAATAEDFHVCAEEQSKAEARIFALKADPARGDVAAALYDDCYDVTPGVEGHSYRNSIALYACMVAPGSPFESEVP